MRFSKILEKAGLIVTDEPELPVAEAPADSSAYESLLNDITAEPPPAPPPPEPINPSAAVTEGTSFDAIYVAAGVTGAAFPAERLIKLLDGLKTMDAANQRAVVSAMDAADDTWKIEDVVDDAQTKIAALQAFGRAQQNAVTAVSQRTQAQQRQLQTDYDQQCEQINQQIAQLQQTLAQAASEHTRAVADLQAENTSANEAALREQTRLRTEIERLNAIVTQFGTTSPESQQGETR